MPLSTREQSYLWDMQNAGNELHEIMQGVKFAKFEKDKLIRYAAERLLLIIGEAANHLSPQFRKKYSEIKWDVFIRFRNILAHEYGESLLTRVWVMSTESLPELLKALDTLLPKENNEE